VNPAERKTLPRWVLVMAAGLAAAVPVQRFRITVRAS